MENKEILKLLQLCASLMDLHQENPFKIRAYENAIFHLEKITQPLANMDINALENIAGLGKGMAAKVNEINQQGSFPELENLLQKTPEGVIEIFQIPGLGAKKVYRLWKELDITSIEELEKACEENKVADLKGFGAKIQENVLKSIHYKQDQKDKLLYAKAQPMAIALEEYLKKTEKIQNFSTTGAFRRGAEIIEVINYLIASENPLEVHAILDKCELIKKNIKISGPFTWRGVFIENNLKLEINICALKNFYTQLFIQTSQPAHQAYVTTSNQTLVQIVQGESFASEKEIYEKANLPYIIPEMREGLFEFDWAKKYKAEEIIELKDIQGILHAHSTYSDGKNTLEEMATFCKNAGYHYLGITDHSKAAFYANGMQEYKITQQHKEIDELNKKLHPFVIFKGIEVDILADGVLDYTDAILKTFDFVIASVHSQLNMDKEKATNRLIKAIENPYTTMLGHPTGRLLLRREGYPLDFEKIIDACAQNNTAIEINANPWRLDLDWRWVYQAMEKGVKIAINPDAHVKEGIHDTFYGVKVARKAGLIKNMTLNTLSASAIQQYFQAKK